MVFNAKSLGTRRIYPPWAVAVGAAMMVAALPAQAVTNLDGNWTVVHGGTGQFSLNADGTHTSTCVVNPDYADAWCPAPSGTFQYSTMGTGSVTFNGTDGTTASTGSLGPSPARTP